MSTPTARLVQCIYHDLGIWEKIERFPDRAGDASRFAAEYLAYNIDRKVEPYSEKEEVPQKVLRDSLQAFAEAEWNCTVYNMHGRYFSLLDPEEEACFREASRLAKLWISRTLMDFWPRWEDQDYTSGASRNLPRSESLRVMKENGGVAGKLMSTTSSARAYSLMIERNRDEREREVVDDSRFDFVQKTAKAVRFMACEPEENMPAQRAVGDCFRAALLASSLHVNLNDQLPNQQLSRLGSIFRTRGTIDLSSASDCVALRHLEYLPRRFQEWCMDLRTPKTSVRGSSYKHTLQKVATMGNGFIFELQSLLYAGWAYGITAVYGGRECDIAVYGDDIIVSTNVAPHLIRFLEWHGFLVNVQKTYYHEDEPFRESCGKHWYAGRDVTPFYIKEPIGTLPTIFRAYNGLKYWTERTGIALPSAIRYLVELIEKEDRVVVPRNWSITSGLHFPCKGCKWPKVSYSQHLHRMVIRQRAMEPPTDDVTERVCDHYALQWFLKEPPLELIDRHLYPDPRHVSREVARDHVGGFPREQQRIVRGTEVATSLWSWVNREILPGDVA
ncbi:MAG: putative replicase protein [Pepevirus faecicola]|uniref:RNA-directed RNA polymerase n=1 Tax=Leviviridae sp. TaxID=2027243 RepID=A0ABY3SVH7_9VIRU|nr:MAG: putative replicase protein [Leviviridae sp.]